MTVLLYTQVHTKLMYTYAPAHEYAAMHEHTCVQCHSSYMMLIGCTVLYMVDCTLVNVA